MEMCELGAALHLTPAGELQVSRPFWDNRRGAQPRQKRICELARGAGKDQQYFRRTPLVIVGKSVWNPYETEMEAYVNSK